VPRVSLNVKPTGRPVTDTRTLAAVALGTALVLVTYVSPIATIPTTAAALGADPVARAWILSSMSLGLASTLLAAGVLGDALGRRRVYLAGLAALAAGAAVCATAQEPWLFVGARVVEGIGGAAVLACGLALLAHQFPPGPARVHATSVWGASVGLGIAAGAVLTALLDVGTGWRETYVVTAVAAVGLLASGVRVLPESRAATSRRVDVPGLVLLVAGLTLLVSALTQGRNGVDAATATLAVLALLALVGFVVVEAHVAEPLLDPGLLRNTRFRSATTGSLVLGAGMIGMASFVPTLAQVAYGAGLWTCALLVVAWAGSSVVTSMLIRHLPRPLEGARPIAVLLVVVAAGLLLATGMSLTSSPYRLVVPMVVSGLATGFLNALLGREAVASVPPDRAAMGSGANNTARYLGAACGITLFVTVATHAGTGPGVAALVDGWNTAVLVAAGLTLLGAAAVAAGGVRRG